jgi:hypothetical protein
MESLEHLFRSALSTMDGWQTFSSYEKACCPVQDIRAFPLLTEPKVQFKAGLSGSNVAPSGMVTYVYGIFLVQTLFVSSTMGTGRATPAAQAGAKGIAEATAGSVTGATVDTGDSVGASVTTSIGADVAVGCTVANNWLRKRKNPATTTNKIIPATISPVVPRDVVLD